ncbi:hypothetical protein ACFU6R_23655, partial [Streptomyces sp. NPDC057499]
MSSQSPSNSSISTDQASPGSNPAAAFGPNEWLVDEIYQQYLQDPSSVDRAWWDFFADYKPGTSGTADKPVPGAPATAAAVTPAPATSAPAPAAPAPAAQAPAPAAPAPGTVPAARLTERLAALPAVVSLNRALEDHETLLLDSNTGMRRAVGHLTGEHGRRRLACLRGPLANPV